MASRRPTSDDSEEDEFQENQLSKLHRNYRHAKEDRREFTLEKKDQLRMQKKTLDQLKSEREELEKMYRLAESLENQKRDEEKTKTLQQMVSEKDSIVNTIQDLKSNATELDEKIRIWEKKIKEKQGELGGANAAATFNANVRKRERVMENRLETTLKRFNTLLTENSSRRSEIDNLRVERQRYEDLFQKAEKRLKELREKLVTCIEHSVTAYEQRKESNTKAILIQGKAENDRAAAEAEIKELERQISHDRKLREFMKLKSQERQEDEDLVAFHKRKEAEAAEKRRKEKEEHSVEAYESKFNRIKEISGEQDLEKLVDKFIEVEDKNFALFNYVNEMNNQTELLQEQIADINREIQHFRSQGVQLEDERKRLLEEIEHKEFRARRTADEHDERTRTTRKILDQCRTGIDSLFKKIGCDRRQIDQMLQSHEGVTEENMLRYLGIIEQRSNELLTAQSMILSKEQNVPFRDRAPNLIGDGPAATVQNVSVPLPNTDDRRDPDDRDDKADEEMKPLTREELKQRALEQVKNLERRAMQDQNKYMDMSSPGLTREKSSAAATKPTLGGDNTKLLTARGR